MIIPCHNYGRYLRDALQSLRDQSVGPAEIVVVDDGSTDHSWSTIEEIRRRDERVVAIRHERARGVAAAVGVGVAASSGDLLVRLDADDVLSPTYLEDLARTLVLTGADVAYAGEELFGALTGFRPAVPFSRSAIARQNIVNASAMFRREVWDMTGGYRSDFDEIGLEDWEFWLHALRLGASFVPVASCRLHYRRHGHSRNSLSHAQDLKAHLKVWRLHRGTVRGIDVAVWLAQASGKKGARLGRRAPR